MNDKERVKNVMSAITTVIMPDTTDSRMSKLLDKRNNAFQDIMIAKDKLHESEVMIFDYLVNNHYFEYLKIDYNKLKRDTFNLK